MIETKTGRPFNPQVLLKQIGQMNVFAISGGRAHFIQNEESEIVTVILPVGSGYRVKIELGWDDLYVVTREFVRKGVAFNKGQRSGVYFDEIGDVAYYASCFRNVEFGEA